MTSASVDRKAERTIILLTCALFGAAAILVLGALTIVLTKANQKQFRATVEDPGRDFTRVTGIPWPRTANVVSVADTHGGLMGEGELYLVFETDRETLESWLAESRPWSSSWKDGPVPPEIGVHCTFGAGSVVAEVGNSVRGGYFGNSTLAPLLGSSSIQYVAAERCCGDLPWHNGNLLIVDLATNRAWLSVWDF
jgi:hypothetical protein